MLGTGHRQRGPFDEIDGIPNALENSMGHLGKFAALFVIGGNGSGSVAEKLLDHGIAVLFTGGTIDADMPPIIPIGFDTAADAAKETVLAAATSADSCGSVMVVEIMGAKRGALPLEAAIAGGADYAIIPEVPIDLKRDLNPRIARKLARGRGFVIVVAEGADFTHEDGQRFLDEAKETAPVQRRIGERLAEILREEFGFSARSVIPRYELRGRNPLASDISKGIAAGREAAQRIVRGERGLVIQPDVVPRPPFKLRRFFTGEAMGRRYTAYMRGHLNWFLRTRSPS